MVHNNAHEVVYGLSADKVIVFVDLDEEDYNVKLGRFIIDCSNSLAKRFLVLFGVSIARDVETVKRHVGLE